MDKFYHEDELFETIIAADKVDRWLDTIRSSSTPPNLRRTAIVDLTRHVNASPVYLEEAKFQGANHVLNKAMQQFMSDEEFLSLITSCISACSGSSAAGETVSTYHIEGPTVDEEGIEVKMKEQSISQGGVGMRIWAAAVVLLRDMCTRPKHLNFIAGKHVLELGSGPGLCGIVAAKLGAASVTLTDYEGPVLSNLQECVEFNASGDVNEDAWEYGNMAVRYLNWNDDRTLINAHENMGGDRHCDSGCSTSEVFRSSPKEIQESETVGKTMTVPALPADITFPVILASDCMYEVDCCRMLAYTIRRRLSPGGHCIMVNAIRQTVFLDTFKKTAELVGLRAKILDVDPVGTVSSDNVSGFSMSLDGVVQRLAGIIGKASDYTDGYKVFLIDRKDAPADWSKYSADQEFVQRNWGNEPSKNF